MIIRLELEFSCGDNEPSRYISVYQGQIFDYPETDEDEGGYSEPNVKIGALEVYYVDRTRIINERESLFEVMDSVSHDTTNCYEALIDQDENDWKKEVQKLIGEDAIIRDNILLINRVEIDEPYRGKGKAAEVVQEVIGRFMSSCAVIVCKPFPLQYSGYEQNPERKNPAYEKKRLAAFRKVAKFWEGLGFQKLPSSEHYVWVEQ